MLAPAWLQLPSSKLGLETPAGLSELYSLAPHRKAAYPATQSGGRVSVPRSITCMGRPQLAQRPRRGATQRCEPGNEGQLGCLLLRSLIEL